MRHFKAKISKLFWGGGTDPSSDSTPTGEENTPSQTLPLRRLRRLVAAPLPRLAQIFSQFLPQRIYAKYNKCVYIYKTANNLFNVV